MSESTVERVHPASPRKRQEARKRGPAPASRELIAACCWLAGVGGLFCWGEPLLESLAEVARSGWSGQSWTRIDAESLSRLYDSTLGELGATLGPLWLSILAAAFAVHCAQAGWSFVPSRAAPDAARIDPARGLARIFSGENVLEALFGVLKVVAVVAVLLWTIYENLGPLSSLTEHAARPAAALLAWIVATAALRLALTLAVLGLADFAWRKWRHEERLRMTPEEWRREQRNLEGDPQLRNRRRTAHRRLATRSS